MKIFITKWWETRGIEAGQGVDALLVDDEGEALVDETVELLQAQA